MQGSCGIGEILRRKFFFKEITFRLRYALGMRQLRHWVGTSCMGTYTVPLLPN